ncbi:MAG TPA: Asp-tRNA(Asn)/Glu-tRNA(Gln) amidotransferase subunit GatC [Chitinophagales bacterium]|nr:Asp-tRNA(Asn)/Glu-tRNA(Gln) amidotransferase subunit GatC [Chitinophagales bacterium]
MITIYQNSKHSLTNSPLLSVYLYNNMHADKELIDKLSNLAKLQFNKAEEQQIVSDLENMIAFIDRLKELHMDGVEPLVYINDAHNQLRNDVVKMEITKEQALQNAPLADSDYFKVPKVLKKL